jgi:hypothetical protein
MSTIAQDYIQRRKASRESEKMKDFALKNGRRMIMMHVCLNCRREMLYSARRRACPFCLGILRLKMKIAKD